MSKEMSVLFFPDSINTTSMSQRKTRQTWTSSVMWRYYWCPVCCIPTTPKQQWKITNFHVSLPLYFLTPSPQLQLLIGPLLRRKVFKSSLLLTLLAKINYFLQCWVAEQLVLFPCNQGCASDICYHPEKRLINGVNLMHLKSRQVHDPECLRLRM